MGGSTASRITSADSGIDGVTRGAAGGDQLMQSHDHTVTDAGHAHDIHYRAVNFATGSTGAIVSISTAETTTAGQAAISNTTGIVIDTSGAGSSGNVQPTLIMNKIIFTGHG